MNTEIKIEQSGAGESNSLIKKPLTPMHSLQPAWYERVNRELLESYRSRGVSEEEMIANARYYWMGFLKGNDFKLVQSEVDERVSHFISLFQESSNHTSLPTTKSNGMNRKPSGQLLHDGVSEETSRVL